MIKSKIFGHPVHMMIIHFPAALYPVSFLLTATSYLLGDKELMTFDFYSISAASLIGWIAVAFGLNDLFEIEPESREFRVGIFHGSLNSIVLLIFSLYALIKTQIYPTLPPANLSELIIKGSAVGIMMVANHYGGELVLRYGIGSMAKTQEDYHNNERKKS